MPLREYGCRVCRTVNEIYHPSTDPAQIPPQICQTCNGEMGLLVSAPVVDTSSTFNREGGGSFTWQGPTGIYHEINNLKQLRNVEKAYQASGHDIRFDAWSAEPSNPDAIDGFGPKYWDGNAKSIEGRGFMDGGK